MIDINILAKRPRVHQHGRAGPVQRAVGGRHAEGPLQQDILLLRVARREDSGKKLIFVFFFNRGIACRYPIVT